MDRATTIRPDDEGLARTRERFLTREPVEPGEVRAPILASWWRSREFRVPADRIDLPFLGDADPETPLLRGAAPVLERLGDQLAGQPISLILTDPAGVVLTQRTGDRDLHRHLERVELVPGYSYGERFVGTNGIGTALEDGRPTYVFGHEHYAEHLENLACAGVPIQHPISGKTIGAVDLTCWRKDAGGLLVALARSTAEQVRQALLTHSSLRELVLFQSYLQACRRTTGIVLAFNSDVVMMNDSARRLLDPADQTMLLNRAHQELAERHRVTTTVTLSSGGKVRLQCRRVSGHREGEIAGGVLTVKLLDSDESAGVALPVVPMFLPGVVGSSPAWLRAAQDVDLGYGREWLVLAGEAGSGKYTLVRGVHQRRNPAGRLHVLDAARRTEDWAGDLRRELVTDPVDTLVVRHVDRLTPPGLGELVAALREARGSTWVAVTLASDAEADPALLELFPRTVTVPPLRRHADDLRDLVPLLLGRLGGGLTCSPAALHLLMRASWPGNVTQLYRVLKQVTQRRRTGTIVPTDLPAEYHALARRPLNRFETVERDAIVRSLEDANGNKVRAAKLLGISRATIYRKIHEYGIVTPGR
ncbi:sigma-54-dependent Fis family transcriptional regulator [Amycolatopsis sacchari]|uniref:GAF domain-containing protein n=1 Tax=Amycolatopsis sacchari TaxID=115433 RepID=A0A1I3K796_9PSEU|nr:helix-turn-helix domain-containing protein [Amycolatopsis sacchari]SFI68382.1 GAF domain-containing protein [Amycolatopsis sacchari]